MTERFFILTPLPSGRREASSSGCDCEVYLGEDAQPMWWSATFPLPEVGARVWIKLNSIGWAVVKGYFVSETDRGNYLGVMTLPENPPKWLRDQVARENKSKQESGRPKPQWMRDGIGCEFGAEIALNRPVTLRPLTSEDEAVAFIPKSPIAKEQK